MGKYILDGVLRWLNRDGWAMQFEDLYHQHANSAARALELDVEDFADILARITFRRCRVGSSKIC
jgi:hypothetical protein